MKNIGGMNKVFLYNMGVGDENTSIDYGKEEDGYRRCRIKCINGS